MAQDEEIKRLLLKGKIVGFEKRTTTGSRTPLMAIHHKRYISDTGRDIAKYLNDRMNYIDHDSFELGLKQDNGEWFFEGDILTDTIFGYEVFVLHYHNGAFCYNRPIDRDFTHSIKTLDPILEWKRLGNIHDNPELLEKNNGAS